MRHLLRNCFSTALFLLLVAGTGLSADNITELEEILSQPLPTETVQTDPPSTAPPRTARRSTQLTVGDVRENLYPEIRVKVTSPGQTILSSQASGKVITLNIRDGERFEKDQLLLAIDPTLEKIQLQKAEANLERQQLILSMTEDLYNLGTKGEIELGLARADIKQAEAEVNFCQARLALMQITAPFPGRAGTVAVREFQVVSEGQALFEIIDESSMELEFIVSSQWLQWFTPGFEFEIHVDELNKRYHAVLERLGGKVDPLSKSVNAYARLTDADDLLMEGMSGEAFITPPDMVAK